MRREHNQGLLKTVERYYGEPLTEKQKASALRDSHKRLLGVCQVLSQLPMKSIRAWFEKNFTELTDVIAEAEELTR